MSRQENEWPGMKMSGLAQEQMIVHENKWMGIKMNAGRCKWVQQLRVPVGMNECR